MWRRILLMTPEGTIKINKENFNRGQFNLTYSRHNILQKAHSNVKKDRCLYFFLSLWISAWLLYWISMYLMPEYAILVIFVQTQADTWNIMLLEVKVGMKSCFFPISLLVLRSISYFVGFCRTLTWKELSILPLYKVHICQNQADPHWTLVCE